jgi:pilus assembly protein CpaB
MRNVGLWIALGSGLLGAAGLELYMRDFEARMTGGKKTPVLLTTRDLRPGAVIERTALATRMMPADYLESRHIRASDIDKVIGMRAAENVAAAEALLWSDLLSFAANERTLARLVHDGKRAISLAMPRASFAGLLLPGDRVDVLHVPAATLAGVGSAAGSRAVRAILTNVMVLAVDDHLGGERADATRARASIVTLSVSPEDGRTLTAADASGELRLLLRNPDDLDLGLDRDLDVNASGAPAVAERTTSSNQLRAETAP